MFLGWAYKHMAKRAYAPMGIWEYGHVRIWAQRLWNPACRNANGDSSISLIEET